MKVRVEDHSKEFGSEVERKVDDALKQMATDITTLAKVKKVPVKSSVLQGRIKPVHIGKLNYEVEANAPYARAQEFGSRTTKSGKEVVFRNFSKPGTGPHYLRDSGDTVAKLFTQYLLGKVKLIYRKF